MTARCRFVQPGKTRLDLTEGYFIEVKTRLSVGERRDAEQAAAGSVDPQGMFRPNVSMAGIASITAYLVDWNLTDPEGKQVRIDTDAKRISALRGLDQATFDEIDAAIGQHIVSIAEDDKDEKKRRSGETPSEATSPSVEP